MAEPVWLMVMFDLPVKRARQRKAANNYRKLLLNRGFSRVQLSVYSRYLINGTAALPLMAYLKETVPAEGYVRVFQLTDRQGSRGWHLYGAEWQEPEEAPDDLLLF